MERKIFTISSVLAILCLSGCGRVEEDMPETSMRAGQNIKTVLQGGYEYLYEYDQEGRLSEIRYSSPEESDSYKVLYALDHHSDGNLTAEGSYFMYEYIYGASKELVSVSYDYFRDTDYYDHTRVFSYSDGLPVSMSICAPSIGEVLAVNYVWENGNMTGLYGVDRYFSSSYECTYTDIINNFKVPLPFYFSIMSADVGQFYPLMCSRNLPRSIRFVHNGEDILRTFSYEFDSEGNISKVAVEYTGGDTEIYEIKYWL